MEAAAASAAAAASGEQVPSAKRRRVEGDAAAAPAGAAGVSAVDNERSMAADGRSSTGHGGAGGAEGRALADVIKNHHATLRKIATEAGAEAAWAANTCKTDELKAYSEAMHTLATREWSSEAETRFTWCRDAMTEYFFDGGQQRAEAKDARRLAHERAARAAAAPPDSGSAAIDASGRAEPAGNPAAGAAETDNAGAAPAAVAGVSKPGTPDAPSSGGPASGAAAPTATAPLPRARRLRVLDVGSCCDPFSRFSDRLEVTAMDLHPADAAPPSVLAGDFLTAPVAPREVQWELGPDAVTPTKAGSPLPESEQAVGPVIVAPPARPAGSGGAGSVDASGRGDGESGAGGGARGIDGGVDRSGESGEVNAAAAGGAVRARVGGIRAHSCDAVVFCLLLSYLPTPRLRFEACRRARAALRPSGLLLVVTPDSAHVGKAAARMKRWRASIESLGFRRWKYEKLTHAHCLAFRAVEPECTPSAPEGVGEGELENGILLQCEL